MALARNCLWEWWCPKDSDNAGASPQYSEKIPRRADVHFYRVFHPRLPP